MIEKVWDRGRALMAVAIQCETSFTTVQLLDSDAANCFSCDEGKAIMKSVGTRYGREVCMVELTEDEFSAVYDFACNNFLGLIESTIANYKGDYQAMGCEATVTRICAVRLSCLKTIAAMGEGK